MAAAILAQIPHLDAARLIARDQLALIRVNDDVVHGCAMVVDALWP